MKRLVLVCCAIFLTAYCGLAHADRYDFLDDYSLDGLLRLRDAVEERIKLLAENDEAQAKPVAQWKSSRMMNEYGEHDGKPCVSLRVPARNSLSTMSTNTLNMEALLECNASQFCIRIFDNQGNLLLHPKEKYYVQLEDGFDNFLCKYVICNDGALKMNILNEFVSGDSFGEIPLILADCNFKIMISTDKYPNEKYIMSACSSGDFFEAWTRAEAERLYKSQPTDDMLKLVSVYYVDKNKEIIATDEAEVFLGTSLVPNQKLVPGYSINMLASSLIANEAGDPLWVVCEEK